MENTDEKAFIRRDVLREGMAYGILNLIDSARTLAQAVSSAPSRSVIDRSNDKIIETLKKQIRVCRKAEIRKNLQKQLTGLLEGEKNDKISTQRILDSTLYHNCMGDFFEIYLALGNQITAWTRQELNEELATLFNVWMQGQMVESQLVLGYVDEFMHCLKLSGLYDLALESYKWRR